MAEDNERIGKREVAVSDRAEVGAGPSKEKLFDCEISPTLKHWDAPGPEAGFHVERNSQGRTVAIEGWLQHRPGERPAADGQIQREFRGEHGLDKSQDAFHVLAHRHGGPTSDLQSAEIVRANLIGADSTINRSYHAAMERRISQDLARGQEIYCKATISYSQDTSRGAVPEYVSYAYFVKSETGEPKDYVVKEYRLRVNQTPGQVPIEGEPLAKEGVRVTAGEVLKRENAVDFYKDEWRGQNPDLPN